ncbi:hypothetical protein ACM66B_006535 [Microbotryomycetes sp. NB124-2]
MQQQRSRSRSPPPRGAGRGGQELRYDDDRDDRHDRGYDRGSARRRQSRSPPPPPRSRHYSSRGDETDRQPDPYRRQNDHSGAGRGQGDRDSRRRDGDERRGTAGDDGWQARRQHRRGRDDDDDSGRPRAIGDGGRARPQLPSQDKVVNDAGVAPQQPYSYGKRNADNGHDKQPPPKPVEPNFAPSGALAAETNTLRGVVLKYNEPPEARKPTKNWRLYCFKGKEQVDLFHVHRQSAYLIGRDRIVADIPVDHPSTSKQHAVLQFRQVGERNEFGDTKSLTKPFIIDLESANGTTVNDETVPASRFYELKSGDVLKFAFSTREYVLLVEN